MTDKRWYAVWVLTGQEREAAKRMESAGAETLLPTAKLWTRRNSAWTESEETLIPGYVFAQCRMDAGLYHRIRETHGVIGWLGKDGMWPQDIPPDEMESVFALARGEPPEKILRNVSIVRRNRRGHGEITLNGHNLRISFTPNDLKQPEETAGDPLPDEEDGEQTQ